MNHSHSRQYTCPMHPEVIKDAPGKCPKCGMDLIPLSAETGHEHAHHQHGESPKEAHTMEAHAHHQHGGHGDHTGMIDDFKRRFYVVLALTIPIMALSPMIQHWLNVDWTFPGSNYILLILSSIVFFYGGKPFLTGFRDDHQPTAPGRGFRRGGGRQAVRPGQ